MFTKIACAAFAVTILVTPSQGASLTSGKELQKRETQRSSTWWTWSSQDGYHSGTGNMPTSSPSASTVVPSANPVDGSYGSGRANPSSPFPVMPKPSQGSSNNQSGYAPSHITGPSISTKPSEIKEWLDAHNRYRAEYGAPPLTWNAQLAAASKRLTNTCFWKHTQNNPYGENMSAGQNSPTEVVDGWVVGPDEKSSYQGANSHPSHFSQVVWVASTEVGCASTVCQHVQGANLPQSPVTFYGCNYNPPGNVLGEFAENVKAAPGGNPQT